MWYLQEVAGGDSQVVEQYLLQTDDFDASTAFMIGVFCELGARLDAAMALYTRAAANGHERAAGHLEQL